MARRGPFAGVLSAALVAAALVAVHAPQAGAATSGSIVFASERAGVNEASGVPAPEIYSMDASGAGLTRLTDNTARDENPAPSPDGSLIAFASDRDGNDEIYVMDASGANQTRLTNNPGSDTRPTWSPDGTNLAFVSNRNGDQEIFVMDASGDNQRSLTSLAYGDNNPAWSPDGTKIAFDRVGLDHNCEIYVVTLATNTAVNITNTPKCDAEPAWSPNGNKIAFRSYRNGNSELYVMNWSGAGQTRLTTNAIEDGSPSWSPDGAKIAFSRCCSGSVHAAPIYTMNADGSGETAMTSGVVDAQPRWGPPPPAAGAVATDIAPAPSSPATASDASAAAPTTDSVSTWSPRFMGGGLPATPAEAQSVANNFDVVTAHPWTYRGLVAEPMKAINPDLLLLTYVNAVMIPKTAAIRYPESWYARDANGNKIQSLTYGTYLMDPSNAAWQAKTAQICGALIASNAYDGCLLDVLGTAPTTEGFATTVPVNPATGNAWSQKDYLAATTQLAGTVRSTVYPSPVYGNGLQNGSAYFGAPPSSKLLDGLDGGMVESFMRMSRDRITAYRTPAAWKADVDMLVDMERRGKPMLALTKGWDAAATTAQENAVHRYALASFLLGTSGLSQFSFLYNEDPDAPALDHPWWHTDIGTPVGPYAPVSGKTNLYQRAWTNGKVFVNADPSATYSISLGGDYTTLEGQSVSTLTLGPHGAEVLTGAPAPPTSIAVSIGATAYTPQMVKADQGKTVQWTNSDSSHHTIVDSSGMALFGGSDIAPSATDSFVFMSAGTYAYRDGVTTSMTGKVTVPLLLTKTSSSSVTVTWAAGAVPSGYAADVQVRLPGATSFVNWRSDQTGSTASYTRPTGKTGQFTFRARLRKTSTGKASLWSPGSAITLS